ncbi:3-deoxy-8-phosphooctulonate synthase [Candidatus Sumerlaeota bacterium]|nr:3-deoxy-8-phosphooctulonate synthase [Candidatus Sumerlaeota bacterium]
MQQVRVGDIRIGDKHPLVLIAGPCAIESESACLRACRRIQDICGKAGVPFIFKSSYDKANRLSGDSYRGPGPRRGLEILHKVREKTKVPVLSDVHSCAEIEEAKEAIDVIQIPALLCRQTDLVVEAARTGKPVNIKKGQFLAPWDMGPIVEKATARGNRSILLTERGSSFGYNNLVTDFRSLAVMRGLGFPVVFDATHSVQLPGGEGRRSGGQREFVEGLARAAVAFGCDGLFLEVHPSPDTAPCDGPNMIDYRCLERLLSQVKRIRETLSDERQRR